MRRRATGGYPSPDEAPPGPRISRTRSGISSRGAGEVAMAASDARDANNKHYALATASARGRGVKMTSPRGTAASGSRASGRAQEVQQGAMESPRAAGTTGQMPWEPGTFVRALARTTSGGVPRVNPAAEATKDVEEAQHFEAELASPSISPVQSQAEIGVCGNPLLSRQKAGLGQCSGPLQHEELLEVEVVVAEMRALTALQTGQIGELGTALRIRDAGLKRLLNMAEGMGSVVDPDEVASGAGLCPLLGQVEAAASAREARLQECEEALAGSEAKVAELTKLLTERKAQVVELQQTVASQKEQLVGLGHELEQRDMWVRELCELGAAAAAMKAKDESIAAAVLADCERATQEVQEAIAGAAALEAHIEQSEGDHGQPVANPVYAGSPLYAIPTSHEGSLRISTAQAANAEIPVNELPTIQVSDQRWPTPGSPRVATTILPVKPMRVLPAVASVPSLASTARATVTTMVHVRTSSPPPQMLPPAASHVASVTTTTLPGSVVAVRRIASPTRLDSRAVAPEGPRLVERYYPPAARRSNSPGPPGGTSSGAHVHPGGTSSGYF
eukprot:gnl/TRDRNA2_/TRDRNA2_128583_c0_seq5.p1 gnl/TRDRNA2_/TRDRNA2_128583_c0~~gnl/TRDRNA2_/TRDRNA2_128583_c0_seq5.p1  ORF type:complete len:562 (-),score=96.92 gnl/TRDRNA2_/TRDRNA2_128583_c0_seq5:33-1718(-)